MDTCKVHAIWGAWGTWLMSITPSFNASFDSLYREVDEVNEVFYCCANVSWWWCFRTSYRCLECTCTYKVEQSIMPEAPNTKHPSPIVTTASIWPQAVSAHRTSSADFYHMKETVSHTVCGKITTIALNKFGKLNQVLWRNNRFSLSLNIRRVRQMCLLSSIQIFRPWLFFSWGRRSNSVHNDVGYCWNMRYQNALRWTLVTIV